MPTNDTKQRTPNEIVEDLLQGHETFRDAFGMSRNETVELAEHGRQLVEHGKHEEALKIFEGLVELDPKEVYFHVALGCTYLQLERPAEAEGEFRKALELQPADIPSNTYLGEILLDRGELAQAAPLLDKAIAADPEERDRFANRARQLKVALERKG